MRAVTASAHLNLRLGLAAIWLACAGCAAAAERSLFFGVELGAALPSEIESTRVNVGVQTNCDQWLAPATLNDGTAVPLPLDQCSPTALPARSNAFDLGAGWFAAAQAGMRLGAAWRIEAEYLHRRQDGERLPLIVPGDPKQREFTERSETIGDVASNGLFANVYYDFRRRDGSRFTPFAGIGLGALGTDIDYSAASIRTSDRAALLDLGRNPNAAGVVSRADAGLSDRVGAWQLLFGFDYALDDCRAITVKARYAKAFDAFKDDGNPWRPLRNHESTVAPGGAPIRYDVDAGKLDFWAVSVGFKFSPR